MHLTIGEAMVAISTAAAAWLMVRAGAAKGMVTLRAASRCASCGKRRDSRDCRCGDRS
jgi:hypothetical protein